MTMPIPKLAPGARRAVLIAAAAVTAGSIAISEAATLAISLIFKLDAALPSYLIAGLLPACLAAPMSYWQFLRLEQLRQAYRQLDLVASTDWLTQCLNRRAFTTAATAAMETGKPGALLVVDADSFKTINDRFGHDRGDEALQRIAEIIRQSVRVTDLVGRLGGEEFGIFVTDASPELARQFAERVREGVTDIAFSPNATPHQLSVSIGIATCAAPAPFASLFQLADQQLYAAKQSGRNRVAMAPIRPAPLELAAA